MIWCVEDDTGIRDIILYTLKNTGFDAKGFCDAEELETALKERKPELILLDIMLPGKDGVELLKGLKKNIETKDIPVIMTTAKGMEYDKIQSLDMGADDYLVKPFGMMEMVSRIKAVLRRYKKHSESAVLKAGDVIVNTEEHTVFVSGKRIILTLKEFELLCLFLSHPGTAFTREQIFSYIWGEDYVGESRTVDMHIGTLRQKIGDNCKMIETVRGVGYRLEAVK